MKLVPCEPERVILRTKKKAAFIRLTKYGVISLSSGLMEAMNLVPGQTVSICFDAENGERWFIKRIGKYTVRKTKKGIFRIDNFTLIREILARLNLDPEKNHTFKVSQDWIPYNGEHYFEILTETEK